MADGTVLVHPAVERSDLRRRMALAVDQLLVAVDLLVRELDRDTPDVDLEPACEDEGAQCDDEHSQGALEGGPGGSHRWHCGSEEEEPSLGSLDVADQRRWSQHQDSEGLWVCVDAEGPVVV